MPVHLSDEIGVSIEIGVEVVKSFIFSTFKSIGKYAKDKYDENDPLGIATSRYVGNIIERNNNVKVLGMREPIPLRSLYVRANIIEKITARTGLSPEELHQLWDYDRRAFGKKTETVDGEDIVNRLQKFMVLGKPGAGKTTYLKFLCLCMLDPKSAIERRRLPIFVTLREWADEKISLADFILRQFDICGIPNADLFLEKILQDGNCMVLFDGLDEVSQESNLDDIIRQIRNFTDKYQDNQFIISCRVAAYNHWFDRFTDVEMADFNEEQVENFIRNWFISEPATAEECWKRLKASQPLMELASVPLLLTLLCIEYSESNDFPPNRAELYERAIETLLTRWDGSRRIRRSEVYKQLSIKRKMSMFARIAFQTFSENQYFIRERRLTGLVEDYIEHMPGFNPADLEPDSHDILKAVEVQHGIFVERAKDVYSFAHLTFQEYFTARHIVDTQLEGSLDSLVIEHLYDSKWVEVFKLTAGMLVDAGVLLLLMHTRANKVLELSKINGCFQQIKQNLKPIRSNFPEVFRRNAAFVLILTLARINTSDRILNRTLVKVLNIDIEFSLDLAFVLALDLDIDDAIYRINKIDQIINNSRPNHIDSNTRNKSLKHARNLVRKFNRDLDLNLDLSILDHFETFITTDMLDEVSRYLSTHNLILSCLSSGCYVSKDVRHKLLHQLFLSNEDLS